MGYPGPTAESTIILSRVPPSAQQEPTRTIQKKYTVVGVVVGLESTLPSAVAKQVDRLFLERTSMLLEPRHSLSRATVCALLFFEYRNQ